MLENITEQQVKDAIQAFLTAQYDKKTEKEQKQLAKAIEDNDVAKIAELNAFLQPFKEKYQKATWLVEAKKWQKTSKSVRTFLKAYIPVLGAIMSISVKQCIIIM
ncbi:hypothetical protein [Faucicola atlantae]|uniref:hypothetical protein n=1 Tax=Faucicola atlantae TaxID=34059 RepID=UPI0025B25634|nr:hypothetical protein [Moraxella atlantae]